jgi:hypothetical protein
MSLQDLYYITNIIFFTLLNLILLGILLLMFYIKKRIDSIQKTIEVGMHKLSDNTAETVVDVGAALTGAAISKAKEYITKKKK